MRRLLRSSGRSHAAGASVVVTEVGEAVGFWMLSEGYADGLNMGMLDKQRG